MILVIDNYDSFTFNLVQALRTAGEQTGERIGEMLDDRDADVAIDEPHAPTVRCARPRPSATSRHAPWTTHSPGVGGRTPLATQLFAVASSVR